MNLDLKATDLKGVMSGDLKIIKGEQQLIAAGNYTFNSSSKSAKLSDYLDIQVQLKKYPIQMLEYWVTNGINNTSGTLSTKDFRIYGKPKAIQLTVYFIFILLVLIKFILSYQSSSILS